jgi:hypothetical protein
VILVYLLVYVVAAVTVGERLHANAWASLAFYAVAGIIWVFPLRPLFRWMNAKG